MMRFNMLLLCIAVAGCAGLDADAPIPTPETVQTLCMDLISTGSATRPRLDRLNRSNWSRYVACSLSKNLVVRHDEVLDNPEAVVAIRFAPNGAVTSVTLKRPSGNEAWDRTVNRAIAAIQPLPPAQALAGVSRIDMHFVPGGELIKGIPSPTLGRPRTCLTTRGSMVCA
jgi:TonB family protein